MDKRIQKTKQQLYVGLKNLLNKMDYGQINVQNLLDESNISRSTFYSHYKKCYILILNHLIYKLSIYS